MIDNKLELLRIFIRGFEKAWFGKLTDEGDFGMKDEANVVSPSQVEIVLDQLRQYWKHEALKSSLKLKDRLLHSS